MFFSDMQSFGYKNVTGVPGPIWPSMSANFASDEQLAQQKSTFQAQSIPQIHTQVVPEYDIISAWLVCRTVSHG